MPGAVFNQGDKITTDDKKKWVHIHKTTGEEISADAYSKLRSEDALTNPALEGEGKESYEATEKYDTYEWNGTGFIFTGEGQTTKSAKHYTSISAANTASMDTTKQAKGAASITKDMFVNTDGSMKTIQEIYNTLKPLLPGITSDELYNQINDMLPQFEKVAQEEKGFLAEQYGGATGKEDDPSTPEDESQVSFAGSLAGKEAGLAKEADIYGLQKEAGKAGAAMRGAYTGGMGAGMRAGVGAQADIAKGFERAGEKYGLAEERAGLAARKGVYGLEKGAAGQFEADIAGWLQEDWFKGKEGGYVHKDRSGIGNNRESFSTFLTQLPTAGGS